jgi:lipopolysaccharide transport system permease protein
MISKQLNRAAIQGYEIHPKKGLLSLDLPAVWQYRELLYFLVWRELKVRYKQAAIGIGWAIIIPFVSMLIFTAIFGLFAKIPSDGLPYPVFAYAALLPWTYFSEAVKRGSTGLVSDAHMIQKIYFPRIIIPLSMAVAPLVDFLLSFFVLILMMLWYGIVPTWGIFALPLFLLLSLGMALGLSFWLGPLNVRYRDIGHALPFIIQIWMYASPIVYPVSMIPERWRTIYYLNPMTGVIEGFRWALLGSSSPDFYAMGASAILVIVILFSGAIYFRKMERTFADVI